MKRAREYNVYTPSNTKKSIFNEIILIGYIDYVSKDVKCSNCLWSGKGRDCTLNGEMNQEHSLTSTDVITRCPNCGEQNSIIRYPTCEEMKMAKTVPQFRYYIDEFWNKLFDIGQNYREAKPMTCKSNSYQNEIIKCPKCKLRDLGQHFRQGDNLETFFWLDCQRCYFENVALVIKNN